MIVWVYKIINICLYTTNHKTDSLTSYSSIGGKSLWLVPPRNFGYGVTCHPFDKVQAHKTTQYYLRDPKSIERKPKLRQFQGHKTKA